MKKKTKPGKLKPEFLYKCVNNKCKHYVFVLNRAVVTCSCGHVMIES